MKKIIFPMLLLLISHLSFSQTELRATDDVYNIQVSGSTIGRLRSYHNNTTQNNRIIMGHDQANGAFDFFIGTTDYGVDKALLSIYKGRNNDPTFYFPYSPNTEGGWTRFIAGSTLAFFSGGHGTSDDKASLVLDTMGHIKIGFGNEVSISQTNYNKYRVFVDKGILSEDYGLGPKSTWADYVFDTNYELMPLNKLESFVKANKHLPNIPTAEEVSKDGYSMHDLNVKLLEKIEELTLYTIEQNKVIEELKADVQRLDKQAVQP